MSIGQKIYKNAFTIMVGLAVWVTIGGILVKIYNAFVYPVSYHGSFVKIWHAPLFSLNYLQDYWKNPLNITINILFIVPAVVCALLLWYGFHVDSRKSEEENKQVVDAFLKRAQSKKNKPPEPKFKIIKKKGKTRRVKK